MQGFKGTILQYQEPNNNFEDYMDERKKLFFKELSELGILPTDTLSTSLFQRLKRVQKNNNHFILLAEQYRMHESINNFISAQFYESKLIPAKIDNNSIGKRDLNIFYKLHSIDIPPPPNILETIFDVCKYALHPNLPMIFLDTMKINAYDSKLDEKFEDMISKFNRKEAEIITKIIYYLI